MSTSKRLAPYLIILFAFAARIFALDSTYVDGDRANPHGMWRPGQAGVSVVITASLLRRTHPHARTQNRHRMSAALQWAGHDITS